MADTRKKPAPEKLAIDGGPKGVQRFTGREEPKIGVEEFFSIAERFGFKAEALARLRAAVSDEDLVEGGPNLARFFTAIPRPPAGEKLEALARELFGVKHVHSVSNGTAALHAAFAAVGVGPGTEVILPALGFIATAMGVMLCGGVPVFCDVDESLQMDPKKIEPLITERTVALGPTHHWGNVAEMDAIVAIAKKHDLKVVEDCAQGPGAKYRGQYVGTFGDVGCFSISAYKIVGGGEAGLVLTNDDRLYDRVRQLAEGSGMWRPTRFGDPRYEGELFIGTNYRLSELEAAVDLVQLRKLETFCAQHRRVSRRIRGQLKTYREITPERLNDADGYIGYMIRFLPDTYELASKIDEALSAEGVGVCWHRGRKHPPDWHVAADMFPVTQSTGHVPGATPYDDPRYAARGGSYRYRRGDCPLAEDFYARELIVLLERWRSDEDCDAIAASINKVLDAYCTPDPAGKRWV